MVHELGGIDFGEIYYNDKGIQKLNVELVEWPKKNGAACIELQVDGKVVIRLHLHEAIRLKSMIDSLVFDYTDYKIESLKD